MEHMDETTKSEWRMGWWPHHSWGIDWRDWHISFPLAITVGAKEVGIYFSLGPLYAWAALERGHKLFENGKPTDLEVGRV